MINTQRQYTFSVVCKRTKYNSTEKQGVAVCGESRKHGFEWECREAILGSTPNTLE